MEGRGGKLNRSLCFRLENVFPNVFHHTGGFVWVHLGRKQRGKVIPHGVQAALLQHPLSLNPIAAGGS